jgi:hypothetical protein
MNVLLDKAKKHKAVRVGPHPVIPPTRDELEVIIAYLKGEITIRAYAVALGIKNPGNASHRVGPVLRFGIEQGFLELKLK